MAENLYEGMFLLDSGKFAANPDGMAQGIVDLLEKAGATVEAHRPWQDGRLAYEIEGRKKGLHYLTYFRIDPEAIKPLTRACKLSDIVIRHLFIKQPQSLFDAMVAALTGAQESLNSESDSEVEMEIEVEVDLESEEEEAAV
ncbi:MAG: hypothetical protein Tsb009_29860 [Planctomycetaceae bacterium]